MTQDASPAPDQPAEESESRNFLEVKIQEDLDSGKYPGVHTRFPPEPNGYLHIGHAKAICVNFGLARQFGGKTNLRFDDTNPVKEDEEYVRAIQEDVKWLGFDWEDRLFFTSDYFGRLYDSAVELIRRGKAYVCSLSAEQVREYRGGWNTVGRNSPDRDRPMEESLDLFERMKAGEFEDGALTLRAKIDMASPNMNLRDPPMYRIRRQSHHRTGNDWCIYPTYDWAHGLCDSFEGITHSLCSLEFQDHRPLYDWFLEALEVYQPEQTEFARLRLTHTVMSKRKLLRLVEEQRVDGWDDPRMPTLSGLRRRGFTPASLRSFCERIGVARFNSMIDLAVLENCVREDLNAWAPRRMAVLKPLKIVITNYPEDQVEEMDAVNNPNDPDAGTRKVPFSRELYIEQDDFLEDPPKKFFRLGPGREVRLRYAYFVTCQEVIKNDAGEVTELHCTYDPETRGGDAPDGRKVKGTLHWVSAKHGISSEVRLYETLFQDENPEDVEEGGDFIDGLNPDSKTVLSQAVVEPALGELEVGAQVQFERTGYFSVDLDSQKNRLVFNRTVTLRDTWAKLVKKGKQGKQG